jgi:hypothetical protein
MGHRISASTNKSSKASALRVFHKNLNSGIEMKIYRCATCRGLITGSQAVIINMAAYHPKHTPKG